MEVKINWRPHMEICEFLTQMASNAELWCFFSSAPKFSAANLALAGFLLTNALGANLPSRH